MVIDSTSAKSSEPGAVRRRRPRLRIARAVPGWVGVWLAVAVLSGWSVGHGFALLAGDISPGEIARARGLIATVAWAACATAVGVCWTMALGRQKHRGSLSGAVLLGAWFLLGLLAGTRGADDPPPDPVDAERLPEAGERAWFLVRVDTVEEKLGGARWRGHLETWAAGDGWVRPRAPIVLGGTWNGAALGRYLLLATRSAGGLPGPVFVWVERAWSLRPEAGPAPGRSAAARAARWRAGFGDQLMVALGSDAGVLAARTFLGPDTPVPSGWDTPFRLTGTMHLLSISGFHFSLLGGVLLLAMRVLLRGSRSAKWPAIGLLGGYAWMVGAPAPVQRSWGGALLLAGGPSWGRAGRTVNALGLVAALLSLLEPRFPAGPSFVLSFAATAGVILGGRATAAWLDTAKDAAKAQGGHAGGPHRAGEGRRQATGRLPAGGLPTAGLATNRLATGRWPRIRLSPRGLARVRPLLLALGVSVGATLLTVPWSFHWFGLLYPLGVLANLVAIPAMAVVMAVQVPALLAVAAGAGAGFPFCAVGRLAGDSFLAILRTMAQVSGAWVWTGQLDRVTSLAWMVVAGVALLAVGRWAEAVRERFRRERAPRERLDRESAAKEHSGRESAAKEHSGREVATAEPFGERRSIGCGSAPGDPGVGVAKGRRWLERPAIARTVVWVVLLFLPLAAGEVRRLRAESPFRGSALDVRWLDVGQGDATLVRFAGATWLVDLGLGSMRGRDRLVPQLLRAGVKRLNRAWVTHGDSDHWGGLIDLLASPVRLDTLVLGEGSTPPAKMLAALRAARHPPVVVRAAAGWHRQGPAVSVRVLHPPKDFRPRDTNAGSLVLVLESVAPAGSVACGETVACAERAPCVGMKSDAASTSQATDAPFRVLLSGDLPRDREAAMFASGGPGAVLVAELAHHGSRTASSPLWWETTRPCLAVISVGRGNAYGLPHAETLAEAARRGVRVLRTDRDGAVRIAFGARGARVGRAGPS